MPIQKTCTRCGRTFLCHHEDITKCQCALVQLTDTARASIHTHYPDQCLCVHCLQEINNSVKQ